MVAPTLTLASGKGRASTEQQSIRSLLHIYAETTKLFRKRGEPVYLLDPKLCRIPNDGGAFREGRSHGERWYLVKHSGYQVTADLSPSQLLAPDK
jgi:hypothetical protein